MAGINCNRFIGGLFISTIIKIGQPSRFIIKGLNEFDGLVCYAHKVYFPRNDELTTVNGISCVPSFGHLGSRHYRYFTESLDTKKTVKQRKTHIVVKCFPVFHVFIDGKFHLDGEVPTGKPFKKINFAYTCI